MEKRSYFEGDKPLRMAPWKLDSKYTDDIQVASTLYSNSYIYAYIIHNHPALNLGYCYSNHWVVENLISHPYQVVWGRYPCKHCKHVSKWQSTELGTSGLVWEQDWNQFHFLKIKIFTLNINRYSGLFPVRIPRL